ncbi:hypothetical protein [Opitutus sp. ER46]|uniref:hypothetical protein n=1 Tax=Opitutus sp. ER46 TaxID=2161864 RepID=UPI0011B1D5BA|nr:hypothetical protein [Opitutus sp. ER46]
MKISAEIPGVLAESSFTHPLTFAASSFTHPAEEPPHCFCFRAPAKTKDPDMMRKYPDIMFEYLDIIRLVPDRQAVIIAALGPYVSGVFAATKTETHREL